MLHGVHFSFTKLQRIALQCTAKHHFALKCVRASLASIAFTTLTTFYHNYIALQQQHCSVVP